MSKQGGKWKAISVGAERRLTAGRVHHRWPCWSPDGEHVAFAVGDGLDAAWVLTDRRGRVARVFEGPAEGGACFGPDGAFAFGRGAGAASEIWMSPGGSAPAVRLLGGDGKRYTEPAWSPDGSWLAFACSDNGRASLWRLTISTGERKPLTADPLRSDGRPAFAPDGDVLFFEGAAEGDIGVFALELLENRLERVTPHGVISRRPAPLSSELTLLERQVDGTATQIVIADRRRGRERVLVDGAREPSVVRLKRRLRVAWAAAGPDEPRRSDIFVARLRGALEEEQAEPAEQPAEAAG
jgi:Tol biopolymer transport system component